MSRRDEGQAEAPRVSLHGLQPFLACGHERPRSGQIFLPGAACAVLSSRIKAASRRRPTRPEWLDFRSCPDFTVSVCAAAGRVVSEDHEGRRRRRPRPPPPRWRRSARRLNTPPTINTASSYHAHQQHGARRRGRPPRQSRGQWRRRSSRPRSPASLPVVAVDVDVPLGPEARVDAVPQRHAAGHGHEHQRRRLKDANLNGVFMSDLSLGWSGGVRLAAAVGHGDGHDRAARFSVTVTLALPP